jgi:hypothetical protein
MMITGHTHHQDLCVTQMAWGRCPFAISDDSGLTKFDFMS